MLLTSIRVFESCEHMKAYSFIEDIMPPSPSPSPAPEYQPSHWHPLVIALVGAICTMFILVSYQKILRRHCLAFRVSTRPENQGNRRRRLNEASNNDPSQQFESLGLDSFVARSLPIVQFKKKGTEINGINTDCAVCLGEFEEGDWIKHLPNCSHVFHVACIDIWFQAHSSCPMCRAHIFDLEYSYDLLQTLPRERFHDQERPSLYVMLQSHVLQNPSAR